MFLPNFICIFYNFQLSSLYDTKPPISKAKITAITRSAIRAIKFYKHVVQSVEKFIMKVSLIIFFLNFIYTHIFKYFHLNGTGWILKSCGMLLPNLKKTCNLWQGVLP